MQVPWRSLGRSPVIVEMDRIYLLAGPKHPEVDESIAAEQEVCRAPLCCFQNDHSRC